MKVTWAIVAAGVLFIAGCSQAVTVVQWFEVPAAVPEVCLMKALKDSEALRGQAVARRGGFIVVKSDSVGGVKQDEIAVGQDTIAGRRRVKVLVQWLSKSMPVDRSRYENGERRANDVALALMAGCGAEKTIIHCVRETPDNGQQPCLLFPDRPL